MLTLPQSFTQGIVNWLRSFMKPPTLREINDKEVTSYYTKLFKNQNGRIPESQEELEAFRENLGNQNTKESDMSPKVATKKAAAPVEAEDDFNLDDLGDLGVEDDLGVTPDDVEAAMGEDVGMDTEVLQAIVESIDTVKASVDANFVSLASRIGGLENRLDKLLKFVEDLKVAPPAPVVTTPAAAGPAKGKAPSSATLELAASAFEKIPAGTYKAEVIATKIAEKSGQDKGTLMAALEALGVVSDRGGVKVVSKK